MCIGGCFGAHQNRSFSKLWAMAALKSLAIFMATFPCSHPDNPSTPCLLHTSTQQQLQARPWTSEPTSSKVSATVSSTATRSLGKCPGTSATRSDLKQVEGVGRQRLKQCKCDLHFDLCSPPKTTKIRPNIAPTCVIPTTNSYCAPNFCTTTANHNQHATNHNQLT